MKKLLLILLSLTSVTTFAKAKSETHLYGKISGDLYSQYTKNETQGVNFFDSGRRAKGFGGFLEFTKEFTPDYEIGLGIGYIHREKGKRNSSTKSRPESWKTPKYDTLPVYILAKYNFFTENSIKPFIKADLGFAFNHTSGFELDVKDYIIPDKEKNKLEIKNGLYAGIGIGIEYNDFLTELSYHITTAKIKGSYSIKDENNIHIENHNFDKKYNNTALTLSIGYKFNF